VRFILVNVMSVVPVLFRRQVHARIVHASAAQVVFMALAMNVVVRLLNFISIHTKLMYIYTVFIYNKLLSFSGSSLGSNKMCGEADARRYVIEISWFFS
jgi:hypothetical protein